MSQSLGESLSTGMQEQPRVASAASELPDASTTDCAIFVDGTTLGSITPSEVPAHAVVAICDGPLATAVEWLSAQPWLCHVLSADMLRHPMAGRHLTNVATLLQSSGKAKLRSWFEEDLVGRAVRLTHASSRVERLEKMASFFASNGIAERTVQQLRDVGDELLTNAFYDAPFAAGAVPAAIPRTAEVALPVENPCDLVYGCSEDVSIIRVRDPFGSLKRDRAIEVLTRCARADMQVELDERMGGAGLGLWRVLDGASFAAISVVEGHHTDFLIGIAKRVRGLRPYGFHWFSKQGAPRRLWQLLDADSTQHSFVTGTTRIGEP